MMSISKWLWPIVLILACVLTEVIWKDKSHLNKLRVELAAALQGNAERDAIIHALHEQAHRNEQARARLETEHARIRTTHAARATLIRKWHDDHPILHTWAESPLPDAIVRLRTHGGFTGAAAYPQRLPER